MKVPASNDNLLTGERLTLQIDCYQKTRDIWLEKDNLDNLIETAGSSGYQWAKGKLIDDGSGSIPQIP
jgi:hypothetical protein